MNPLDQTKIRAWKHQPDLPTENYPLSTVLPAKPRIRLNYTTIVGIATAVLYGLFYLLFR